MEILQNGEVNSFETQSEEFFHGLDGTTGELLVDTFEEGISLMEAKERAYIGPLALYKQVNKAVVVIFINYFNILSQERIKKVNGVITPKSMCEFKGLLDVNGTYVKSIPENPTGIIKHFILLNYNGIDIVFIIESIKENGEIKYFIKATSVDVIKYKSGDFYLDILKEAINLSNLKGSYLTLSDNFLAWVIGDLKKLSFDDVYLPKPLMDDLSIYSKLYEDKGILQRFMLNGIPGTGKTESTRAISNILNDKGVTIIKTNICDIIKQKFELAVILAPSLIILDDIDLYLGDRNHGGVSARLGAFLDILDGVDKLPTNVGIIATTNAPHLIDLAAQRPGRFNKLLFFDVLTEDNITKIIEKSLNSMNKEFNNITEHDFLILTDDKLVNFFKKEGCTGAFIFETIKNIKYKNEILNVPLILDDIVKEISENSKILNKKLETNRIKSNFDNNSSNKVGY